MLNKNLIFLIFSFILIACKSEISVSTLSDTTALTNPNQIYVEEVQVQNITTDSFDVKMIFSSDKNLNSNSTFYYCNETSNPGCNPYDGNSFSMNKSINFFEAQLSISKPQFSPGDKISYKIKITDKDGVVGRETYGQLTLLAAPIKNIFRSVQPGIASFVDSNSTGTLSISSGEATFSSALSDSVGVGDILIYNSDAKLAMIVERVSANKFKIKKLDGEDYTENVITNSDWSIYRAYESLADAENGNESGLIPAGVRDFDSWSGGRDLVSNNEKWNIALYVGDIDSTFTHIDSWNTSSTNTLRIYTPFDSSEVGISQRHDGAWSPYKYMRTGISANFCSLSISSSNVIVDGIQIYNSDHPGTGGKCGLTTDAENIQISNNLIKGHRSSGNYQDSGLFLMGTFSGVVFNNVVDGFHHGIYTQPTSSKKIFYNNTLVHQAENGISLGSGTGGTVNTTIFKNNLVIDSGANSFLFVGSPYTSDYNASDDAFAMGTNSIRNVKIKFNEKEAFDYRLRGNDFDVIGAGVDLSNDPHFDFNKDNRNESILRWDIGASNAPRAKFRSVGTNSSNLKGAADKELSVSLNSNNHTVLTLSGGTTSLASNIGVGDVFLYDYNNSGSLNSRAFIHKRISNDEFIVKNKDGLNVELTSSNSTSWSIFRAYTSMASAVSNNENSNILASLVNFDDFNGRDLVTNKEQWTFAFYADGNDSGSAYFDNYTSSSLFKLRLTAPFETDEVGESQRHEGVWDSSKYNFSCSMMDACVRVAGSGATVEGLQIENTMSLNSGNPGGISISNSEAFETSLAKNNIVRSTSKTGGNSIDRAISLSGVLNSISIAGNNIVDGFGAGIATYASAGTYIVYNNTVSNSELCFNGLDSGSVKFFYNNIAYSCNGNDYNFFGSRFTSHNISSDGSSPDSSFRNITPLFFNNIEGDFRVLGSDTNVVSNGLDLSIDFYFTPRKDVKNVEIVNWDIGAHQYLDYSISSSSWNDLPSGSFYLIANETQLDDLENNCGDVLTATCDKNFMLIEDINLTGITWEGIGSSANDYIGDFDGNGKTISNITISGGSEGYGLFGRTTSADIKNLNLTVNIDGNSNGYVGGLLAVANGGTFDNISVSGTITNCASTCGGAFGRINGGTVTNSNTDVTISGGSFTGGLLGSADNTSVSDSYALGDVTSSGTSVGGLIGVGGDVGGTYNNVFAKGNVTAVGYVGGLMGNVNKNTKFTNCHASGVVIATKDGSDNSMAGGLIGTMNTSTSTMEIDTCYATGDVFGTGLNVGGLLGHAGNSGSKIIRNSFAIGNVFSSDENVGGLVGDFTGDIYDSFATGNVTGLKDVGGLAGVFSTGSLLRSYATGNIYSKSVGLTNHAGGLIGIAESSPTISKCYASGNVYATRAAAGGLIGRINGGSVTKAYASGNVFASVGASTGGLIGISQTSYSEVFATGNVVGDTSVGGLIGDASLAGSDCYAFGSVNGNTDVGGLIGVLGSTTVSDCFSAGRVSGNTNVGASIGNDTGTATNIMFNSDNTAVAAGSAVAKTTEELQETESLAVLGLGANWVRLDGATYPELNFTYRGQCLIDMSLKNYNDLGNGTKNDPYIICNSNQFKDILAKDCSAHYVLGLDINLSDEDFNSYRICHLGIFTGSFNGNERTVTNFFTSNHSLTYANDGNFLNFNIFGDVNTNTDSNSFFTSIARSGGHYINNKIFGSLQTTGGGENGAIVPSLSGGLNGNGVVINQNRMIGSIQTNSSGNGGIVGESSSKTHIKRNFNYANLDVGGNSGGILGQSSSPSGAYITDVIEQNASFGNVTVTSGNSGGIVGSGHTADILKNYYNGTISFSTIRAGGIVGYNYNGRSENNYVFGSIDGQGTGEDVGGIIGRYGRAEFNLAEIMINNVVSNFGGIAGDTVSFNQNFWNIDGGVVDGLGSGAGSSVGNYEGKTSSEVDDYAIYLAAGWDLWDLSQGVGNLINQTWIMANNIRKPRLRWMLHPICQANIDAVNFDDIGSGTDLDPYLICFEEQMDDLSHLCDDDSSLACGHTFQLMNDLDMSNVGNESIGHLNNPFTGKFFGNGHTLTNLSLSFPGEDNIGLFGRVDGAVIQDLNITRAYIEGRNLVGILAGFVSSDSLITNIEVQGEINSTGTRVGGVIGDADYVSLNRIKAMVTISAQDSRVGGIAGELDYQSTLYNSYVRGQISTLDNGAGGAIGSVRGVVKFVGANVDITGGAGTSSLGGLIGYINGGGADVSHSYALGDVTGNNFVGGFIGSFDYSNFPIENSYARGNVSATGSYAGGFVGINRGEVINKSYAFGNVSGASVNNGGFFGTTTGSPDFNYTYWNGDNVGGSGVNDKYMPLSETQMQSGGNFSTWNFNNVWIETDLGPELIMPNSLMR